MWKFSAKNRAQFWYFSSIFLATQPLNYSKLTDGKLVASLSMLTEHNFPPLSQEMHPFLTANQQKTRNFIAQFEHFQLVLLACQTRKNALMNGHCIHYASFDEVECVCVCEVFVCD